MREMKDSGVQWIGEIPKDWNYTKLKFVSKISSGIAISKEEYEDNGQYPIFGANGVVGYCNKKNNTEEVLVTGRVGSIGFVHKVSNAWITDNALVLRIIDDIKDFACYAMKLLDYNQMISGTAMPLITAGKLYEQMIPIASTDEMHRIASFLDSKCAEIDALSADIQKEIETLQEYRKSVITEAVTKGLDPNVDVKDSGIEWIREIPANWVVHSAKYHIDIENGSDPKTEGSIPVYGSGTNSFKTCGEYKEGPAVLVGRKGSIDNPRYIEHRFWNVDTAFNVKAKNGFLLRYYYYLALSFDYKYYISQTTLPSMTQTNYENMSIPVPSIEEQNNIVSFLDTKCTEIDSIIVDKQKQLDTLAEYRKSLIYEYVTGKKEVPTA